MSPSVLGLFFSMWEMSHLVLRYSCCWQAIRGEGSQKEILNPIIEKEELMLLPGCFLLGLSNEGTG